MGGLVVVVGTCVGDTWAWRMGVGCGWAVVVLWRVSCVGDTWA